MIRPSFHCPLKREPMRFLVDECTGTTVADHLRRKGHDVFSVFDEEPGATDEKVLEIAVSKGLVLITNDKDFGEFVFRSHKAHAGIILLRLSDERPANKIKVLDRFLQNYSDNVAGVFCVVSETSVRINNG